MFHQGPDNTKEPGLGIPELLWGPRGVMPLTPRIANHRIGNRWSLAIRLSPVSRLLVNISINNSSIASPIMSPTQGEKPEKRKRKKRVPLNCSGASSMTAANRVTDRTRMPPAQNEV